MTKDPEPAVDFNTVLLHEQCEISQGRMLKGNIPDGVPRSGIGLSGGGIRSATINLGFLQALNEMRMLHWFDYLSTVSGGGYIGAWLVANIKNRTRDKGNGNYDSVFEPQGDPLRRLRRYSRYLAPESGFFSADTWAIVTIWIRNTLLIQSAVLAAVAAVLLLPRFVYPLFHAAETANGALLASLISAFLLLLGCGQIWRELGPLGAAPNHQRCGPVRKVEGAPDRSHPRALDEGLTKQARIQWLVVVPLILAAFAASIGIWSVAVRRDFLWKNPQLLDARWYLSHVVQLSPAIVFFILAAVMTQRCRCEKPFTFWLVLNPVACAFAGLLLFMGLTRLAVLLDLQVKLGPPPILWWPIIGPAATLIAFSLVVVLHIGLFGADMDDRIREWWSRLGAWLLIYSLGVLALMFLALASPGLVSLSWTTYSQLIKPMAVLTWVASTLVSVLAGKSPRTENGKANKADRPSYMDLLLRFAPYISLAGLLVLAAIAVDSLIELLAPHLTHKTFAYDQGLWAAVILLVLTLMAGSLLWRRVDLNEFSMNRFYRNRLVRCYMGSAHFSRSPDAFTNFDLSDDFAISCLRRGKIVKTPEGGVLVCEPLDLKIPPGDRYDGPYPIINTALNTSQGGDLDLQDRKAESFIFTPQYSGSQRPEGVPPSDGRKEGFRRTVDYMYSDGGPSYGTAISISGAAASPNWGYHTSPAVAFLLTIFNVRLGWWTPNPTGRYWDDAHHGWQLRHLVQELFGSASARDELLYLSDGGHFDNIGLYELVRRRCNFIVIGDGEEDGLLQFESLAGAIRKCWIDLRVRIDIDVSSICDRDKNGYSKAHCALGRIVYPDGGDEGLLVYLKASMTGDEATDVAQFRVASPEFPHESTLDQFFNENQFESYRKLGYHIAKKTFASVIEKSRKAQGRYWDTFSIYLSQELTAAARSGSDKFTEHAQTLAKLWEQIRADNSLAFLDYQFFPEWQQILKSGPAGRVTPRALSEQWPQVPEVFRRAMYVCQSAMQLMESVYLDLGLESEWSHPDHRGWMNLFRHWSWSGMFRIAWAVARSTYGARFQSFCEQRLGLQPEPMLITALTHAQALAPDSKFNWVEVEQVLPKLDPALTIHRIDIPVSGVDPRVVLTVGFVAERNGVLEAIRIQDHLRKMGLGSMAIATLKGRQVLTGRSNKFDLKPGVEDLYADWVRKRF